MTSPPLFRVQMAARALRAGALLAYPTEGVWGLGCDPDNLEAVLALLALKDRDMDKGLILVAASPEQIAPYIEHLPPAQQNEMWHKWPGPHTWLVPCNERVPPWISGGRPTVALRVSRHPAVVALCQAFGHPIVSTSANRSGQRPALSPLELRCLFGRHMSRSRPPFMVLPGTLTQAGKPSTLQDLCSGEIVRA